MRTARWSVVAILTAAAAVSACARPAVPAPSPASVPVSWVPTTIVSQAPTPSVSVTAGPTGSPAPDTPLSVTRGSTEIAYVCGTVCLIGGDGSDPHPILTGGSLAFSADGERVARAWNPYGEGSSVGEVDIGPSSGPPDQTVWRFVGTTSDAPAWSPDGRRLAVTVRPPDVGLLAHPTAPGLWVLNADGSDAHLVAANVAGPVTWDPTGTRIAFLAPNGPTDAPFTVSIDTVAASGGAATVIAVVWRAWVSSVESFPGDGWAWLSWSPDGQTILYTHSGGLWAMPGHAQVESVSVVGGTTKVLLGGPVTDDFSDATYSPDGSKFVVAVTCNVPTSYGNPDIGYNELDIADADGTHFAPLMSPRQRRPLR